MALEWGKNNSATVHDITIMNSNGSDVYYFPLAFVLFHTILSYSIP